MNKSRTHMLPSRPKIVSGMNLPRLPEPQRNPPATLYFSCFSAAENSLLKCKKFPISREILAARSEFAAICCISGAESSKIKDLVLIFFVSARGRAPRDARRQPIAAGH